MNNIPCLLQSNNYEEVGCTKNNHWCVTHTPLDKKDIQGNFLTIANKKKPNFEDVETQLNSGECLTFLKSEEGAWKKAKIGLTLEDPKTGNTYVVTDEQQKNSQNLKEFIEKTKNEIMIQHDIHTKHPNIAPKIVAANIYSDYFFNPAKKDGCEMIDKNKKAFIQLLMENAENGGYDELYHTRKKYNIKPIGKKNLKNDSNWLENEWYKGDAKEIIEKLFETIHKVHKIGYIHGDLRDSNIFIHKDTKDIKLIDFGLSYKIKEYRNKSDHDCSSLEKEVYTNFKNNKSENYWYYIMLMELSKALRKNEKGIPILSFLDNILFPYKKDEDYLTWRGTCTDFYKDTIIPFKKFIATKYKEYVNNNPKSVYVKESRLTKKTKSGKGISFSDEETKVTTYNTYKIGQEEYTDPYTIPPGDGEDGEGYKIF